MNRENKLQARRLFCPLVLLLTLVCSNAHGQVPKPDNRRNEPRNNNGAKTGAPETKAVPATPPIDDSVIEERLVGLALKGPMYDASFHEVKIANYKVKSTKKSWFNLLTVSLNYNDQTFVTPVPGQAQYVYPKYYFGLTIPIGTIVSKGSEIKGAKEEVKIAQDHRDDLSRTIRADVLSKYKQYKTYQALVVLESQVVDDIHAAFLQAEKRFNDGSVTIEVYSDASRSYTAEMTKMLNLQLQEDLVKLDIEKIIGVKLETVIN
jgi:outer membrane protein TolC